MVILALHFSRKTFNTKIHNHSQRPSLATKQGFEKWHSESFTKWKRGSVSEWVTGWLRLECYTPHPATERFSHILHVQMSQQLTLIFFYLQALTTATASTISCICKRKLILVQFKSRAFSFHQQPPLYFLCYQMLERQPVGCLWNWQQGRQNTRVQRAFF